MKSTEAAHQIFDILQALPMEDQKATLEIAKSLMTAEETRRIRSQAEAKAAQRKDQYPSLAESEGSLQ